MTARRAVGDQRGNRVGRRRRVAEVAADAGPALNLPAADDPGRIGQRRIGRRDLGVVIDPIARHARPQPQALGRRVAQLHQLGNLLDIDDQVRLAQPFAKLHEDVGAAGQDPGLAVGARPAASSLPRKRRRRRVGKVFQGTAPRVESEIQSPRPKVMNGDIVNSTSDLDIGRTHRTISDIATLDPATSDLIICRLHRSPNTNTFCGSGRSACGFSSLKSRLGWMSRLCWYLSLSYSVMLPAIS